MNKQQAREECVKMWDWIRKNPTKSKLSYALEICPEAENWRHNCAACEATCIKVGREKCHKCFITWPLLSDYDVSPFGYMCESSVYKRWANAWNYMNFRATQRWATEVLKLALAARIQPED